MDAETTFAELDAGYLHDLHGLIPGIARLDLASSPDHSFTGHDMAELSEAWSYPPSFEAIAPPYLGLAHPGTDDASTGLNFFEGHGLPVGPDPTALPLDERLSWLVRPGALDNAPDQDVQTPFVEWSQHMSQHMNWNGANGAPSLSEMDAEAMQTALSSSSSDLSDLSFIEPSLDLEDIPGVYTGDDWEGSPDPVAVELALAMADYLEPACRVKCEDELLQHHGYVGYPGPRGQAAFRQTRKGSRVKTERKRKTSSSGRRIKGSIHRRNGGIVPRGLHQCGICGKSFQRLEHLKRHGLLHDPNRPWYPCRSVKCQRLFDRTDNLREHERRHKNHKRTDYDSDLEVD
ncbi:MAG: homeodomain transcription factor ste12 [Phylliscum demangeonii]|nr:MAG: homeodomain transcription factor ste12 [Phylliscum demangeonii]